MNGFVFLEVGSSLFEADNASSLLAAGGDVCLRLTMPPRWWQQVLRLADGAAG
jgi:hypothetical protein